MSFNKTAQTIARRAVVAIAQVTVPAVERACNKALNFTNTIQRQNRNFALFAWHMQKELSKLNAHTQEMVR